ncbi:unnamed protein product [Calicophoron daubneyi]|uniref:Major facilitator superfamily (MFS) profile domain-containing protein n=1 Tax=Calicophoron daubneyi TaxID=300641 RepID=A0AAV2TPI7_CALDB
MKFGGKKAKNFEEEPDRSEEITYFRNRCIDRGPAVVVAACAFLSFALHYGLLSVGAILFPAFIEVTGYPISVITWIATGQFAVAFCLSPVYNRLVDLVPTLAITIGAVFVTSGALVATSFMNNYFGILGLYTGVVGFGLGISVVRVMAVTADYFDRYRVIALAVCSSGAGFGTFLYAKLGAILIDNYTWKITLVGFALIHLNVIPLSIVLHPLPPEPTPKPTVLVAQHPDLIESNIPLEELGSKFQEGQGLFQSLVSFGSVQNMISSAVIGRPRGTTRPVRDLRVIIEFVKATVDKTTNQINIDPIALLSDPGPEILRQMDEATKQYLSDPNSDVDSLMIPFIFIIGEIQGTLVVGKSLDHKPITGADLKDVLQSRLEIGSSADISTFDPAVRRQSQAMIGSSFASVTIAASERKQLRRTIRDMVKKAENRVEALTRTLNARHEFVHPSPIIAIIDQSDYFAQCQMEMTDIGSGIKTAGLYFNQDHIIEEEEDIENEVGGMKDMAVSVHEQGSSGEAVRPAPDDSNVDKSQIGSQIHRSYLFGSHLSHLGPGAMHRRRESKVIHSTLELPGGNRFEGPIYRSGDHRASIIALNTPHEAVNMLTSKLIEEPKMKVAPGAKKSLPKVLILHPLFLSFLLSRAFVYIADSISLSHLSNFALSLNFPADVAAGLLSFIGLANLFARIGTGIFGYFLKSLDPRFLVAGLLGILATYTILMPLFPTYGCLFGYAIMYGILSSPSFAYAPTMAYDIIGPGRYDEAMSYEFQFEATAYLIGAPLGGIIKEASNNYAHCFLVGGLAQVVSCVILGLQAIYFSPKCRKLASAIRHSLAKGNKREREDCQGTETIALDSHT